MQSAKSQRALLYIFIFVMCIFFVLAYRQEMQSRQLKQSTYLLCVQRWKNVDRTNHYLRGMIRIEQHNPFVTTSPDTVHARIKLFRAAILVPPNCGIVK